MATSTWRKFGNHDGDHRFLGKKSIRIIFLLTKTPNHFFLKKKFLSSTLLKQQNVHIKSKCWLFHVRRKKKNVMKLSKSVGCKKIRNEVNHSIPGSPFPLVYYQPRGFKNSHPRIPPLKPNPLLNISVSKKFLQLHPKRTIAFSMAPSSRSLRIHKGPWDIPLSTPLWYQLLIISWIKSKRRWETRQGVRKTWKSAQDNPAALSLECQTKNFSIRPRQKFFLG